MSKAWAGGSTKAWRKLRQMVLARDHWTCQLCGQPINPMLRNPHPWSACVHHTRGRAITGDDPKYLAAAHRQCNLEAGEPGKTNPQPRPMTRW